MSCHFRRLRSKAGGGTPAPGPSPTAQTPPDNISLSVSLVR